MFATPGALFDEIKRAESYRDSCMPCVEDMQRHYKGPARAAGKTDGWTWYPENHYHEWTSGVLPQVIAANPIVDVSTVRPGLMGIVALAMEAGVNRWVEDVQFQKIGERLGVDFGFAWAVALTTSQGYGAYGKHRPCVTKLARKTFGFDPAAREYCEARYAFHAIACRKAELEARAGTEAGWDVAAVKAMAVGVGVDAQGRPVAESQGRDEVVYYEVWVPEIKLESGEKYCGAILTIAYCVEADGGKQAKWLRAPRAYFGPKTGPYTLIGAYVVPDEAYPLSPMAAVEANVREVNAHARSNADAAGSYKRIFVYDEKDTDSAEKLLATKNGMGCGIKGFDKNAFLPVELGGATETGIAYEEYARARLNRVSGMTDASRADNTGATATFDAIADKWSEARIGHQAGKFLDGLTDVLGKVMWFMKEDGRVVQAMADIAPEQAEELGFKQNGDGDYELVGGAWAGPFEDLRLTIEVGSTARKDSVQRKAETMQFANWAAAMAPAVIANPQVLWDDLYALVGRTFGVRDGERYLDMAKANELSEALAGAQGQPETPDVDPLVTVTPRAGPYGGSQGAGKPAYAPKPATGPKPAQAPKPMAKAVGA